MTKMVNKVTLTVAKSDLAATEGPDTGLPVAAAQDTARRIADNLFELPAFRRMVRHMVLSPMWLVLTLLPTIMLMLGMSKRELDLPLPTVLLIYLLRTAIWGSMLILFLPRWARFCMARNLPFAFAYLALLSIGFLVVNLVTFVSGNSPDLAFLVLRFLRQMAIATVLSLIMLKFVEREIEGLGSDPALVPVWWPVRPEPVDPAQAKGPQQADISLLDESLTGRILSIRAQNQYVEVATPAKTHLLRMPFQQALTKLPSASGHRVHRSWWLANDMPVKLNRVGQNYEAEDAQGRVYPVSKPNLDLVRSLIERNSSQNP